MPNEVAGVQTEDLRLKNVRTQMKNRHESELRDIEARNGTETQRLIENHAAQLGELKNAYDVQISQEAEHLEDRLSQVRAGNADRVAMEKHAGDQEVEKVQKANQDKIEEYRKNGEAKLQNVRKDLQLQAEVLHNQEKEEARRANFVARNSKTKENG